MTLTAEQRKMIELLIEYDPTGLEADALRALLAEYDRLTQPSGDPQWLVAEIWQAIGRYGIEICRPDAELAPPQYLLDAIQRARDEIAAANARAEAIPRQPTKAMLDAVRREYEIDCNTGEATHIWYLMYDIAANERDKELPKQIVTIISETPRSEIWCAYCSHKIVLRGVNKDGAPARAEQEGK